MFTRRKFISYRIPITRALNSALVTLYMLFMLLHVSYYLGGGIGIFGPSDIRSPCSAAAFSAMTYEIYEQLISDIDIHLTYYFFLLYHIEIPIKG